MNCLELEMVEIEDAASEEQYREATPFPGRDGGTRPGDRVDSRVAEVLRGQLARGSMPT